MKKWRRTERMRSPCGIFQPLKSKLPSTCARIRSNLGVLISISSVFRSHLLQFVVHGPSCLLPSSAGPLVFSVVDNSLHRHQQPLVSLDVTHTHIRLRSAFVVMVRSPLCCDCSMTAIAI